MRVALDTNLLVYAELEPESDKGRRSRDMVLRAARDGVIPAQVLGEFLRVVQRRAPGAFDGAIKQVALYRSAFPTPTMTGDTITAAAELARAHQIQLWDGVICVAALEAGAKALLTEDLQDGRVLEGLRFINPFNSANADALDGLLAP